MGDAQAHRVATVVDEARVTMLVVSGRGEDSQWFDYKPTFFSGSIRVEWEKETMNIILPSDVADALISRGYAIRLEEEP